MREFFGIGGYQRQPEGYLSWQHLVFVTSLMLVMVLSALFLGKRRKHASLTVKNVPLIWAAVWLDGLELIKIILACSQDGEAWKHVLPLFLCSIQLITVPLAAFARGRLKASALDFVCIFGILGAVLGTYGAGQNYNAYPVLSFDNVVSGLTHAISGFASLYILFAGMASMKRGNIVLTFGILGFFCIAAFTANALLDYNYMFLRRGDGTPYDLLFQLVKGNPVLYPLGVIALFVLYICLYYGIFYLAGKKEKAKTVSV